MSFPIIASITTAIGSGISAFGAVQRGRSQDAIGRFNAAQRERESTMQALSLQTQANLAENRAKAEYELRAQEAQARFSNAALIEQRAELQSRIDRDNISKFTKDAARMQATQRAKIAASGIVESSGTPLDLIAETAGLIQKDREARHFESQLTRHTLFREASLERFGGQAALAGATLDRDSAVSAAAIDRVSAEGVASSGQREAELLRLTGANKRRQAGFEAAGNIFSGATDIFARMAQFDIS